MKHIFIMDLILHLQANQKHLLVFYFPNIIKSNKRALSELTSKQTFLEIDISLMMHAFQRISKFGLLNVAMV